MQKENLFFTAGQFAKLHHLNKRTLHYYDDIGLFSPAHKGENGYRYYTCRQSVELENILSLRELGMSIEEIRRYLNHPNAGAFLEIATQKSREIDAQIKRLKKLKAVLSEKQGTLSLCAGIYDGKIEVIRYPKRFLLLTPVQFRESALTDMDQVMVHLQTAWEGSAFKAGCGSYISLDKVKRGQFDSYDGLFTFMEHPKKGAAIQVKPEGGYLCGYCIGAWDKIPALYQKMLAFAEANKLTLTGDCYETGLNEFAISCEAEYVTKVEIQCGAIDLRQD